LFWIKVKIDFGPYFSKSVKIYPMNVANDVPHVIFFFF